jgi:hypothetical protein
MKPSFLITIDNEGDDLWSHPTQVTTNNARCLPRFQALCDEYGLKPTYLTTHEMATCPEFIALGKDVLRRAAGEVGAHLHAWNSPPIRPLTENDSEHCPYSTEYGPDLLRKKVQALTQILEDTFEIKMTSHRAGRWGFDGVYAQALIDSGYLVDCSVTPGWSWRTSLGKPDGKGGPDYTACPQQAYYVDLDDIRKPGRSDLLEVPVTIMRTSPRQVDDIRVKLRERAIARRAVNRLFPPLTWLRPNGRNRRGMLRLLQKARQEGRDYVEFMLHSSELMPGANPTFRDEASIEALYKDLRAVFATAAEWFAPATLTEYSRAFSGRIAR